MRNSGGRSAESGRGEGLATEGGAAALDYAFRVLARKRMISVIHPENAIYIRVA
ncbi:GNAT family N-acetyltransferase [Pseudofrankia sp. BMG5.36]|uniref:GNAT family N-acetyltransferase n=1 Tax=Pseudofrankia sp. BMG5.36 TaxID=1834512 RepID=UPI0032D5737C